MGFATPFLTFKDSKVVEASKRFGRGCKPRPAQKSNQDLSHLFLLGFFTANLEKQANQMLQLSQYLKSYANSKELHDDFQSKLEDKSTIISNVGKI